MTSPNQLLAEFDVFPDHGTVVIEDAGKTVMPDDVPTWGVNMATATDHTLTVLTMSADMADEFGRNVAVRVYRGTDPTGLGELAFDGALTFSEPSLAIGQILSLPEDRHKVAISRTGRVQVQVYWRNTIPEVFPDPTDLNILINDTM
ncbi:hypothetical protein QN239_31260 [Mycolicibacterium sp. Y3]